MGRNKIVRDFPLQPKSIVWKDGREKDEIESILKDLSEHMPDECKGKLNKSILWAVRLLKECYKEFSSEGMECVEYILVMKAYNQHTPVETDLDRKET